MTARPYGQNPCPAMKERREERHAPTATQLGGLLVACLATLGPPQQSFAAELPKAEIWYGSRRVDGPAETAAPVQAATPAAAPAAPTAPPATPGPVPPPPAAPPVTVMVVPAAPTPVTTVPGHAAHGGQGHGQGAARQASSCPPRTTLPTRRPKAVARAPQRRRPPAAHMLPKLNYSATSGGSPAAKPPTETDIATRPSLTFQFAATQTNDAATSTPTLLTTPGAVPKRDSPEEVLDGPPEAPEPQATETAPAQNRDQAVRLASACMPLDAVASMDAAVPARHSHDATRDDKVMPVVDRPVGQASHPLPAEVTPAAPSLPAVAGGAVAGALVAGLFTLCLVVRGGNRNATIRLEWVNSGGPLVSGMSWPTGNDGVIRAALPAVQGEAPFAASQSRSSGTGETDETGTKGATRGGAPKQEDLIQQIFADNVALRAKLGRHAA